MREYKYQHKVQYYETDQMKIVHHSNYIRWFEEARVAMLDEVGYPLEKLEELEIIIPVVDVTCQYKNMTRFGEVVEVVSKVEKYNSVKLEYSYEVYGVENHELKVTGTSSHCFLNSDYKVTSLKKTHPELNKKFLELFV